MLVPKLYVSSKMKHLNTNVPTSVADRLTELIPDEEWKMTKHAQHSARLSLPIYRTAFVVRPGHLLRIVNMHGEDH